ncbi:MAG: tetratricopeptide repeat protein [Deltaproteobacteria bacterium]|nr:tetratricopeptide repeat protein [Deltaproteobacteria bacterium]
MTCPGIDALALFADGLLEGPELEVVDSHVDQCPRCRQLTVQLARSGELDSPPVQLSTRPPQTFGRYTIQALLGTGGMGAVFRAFDPALDRNVAIKLLHMHAEGTERATEYRTRLLREARALARLAHPNVTVVHDVGMVGEQAFFAMELVEGVSLRQWLRQENPPWRDILDLFGQAGRGIAAAHKAGVIHRDFKPDNVLLGSDMRARVTDFGLARFPLGADPPDSSREVEDLEAATPHLTGKGVVLGTPGYMAPEQLACRDADARSDQFSFCVALYEALFNQRPFAGKSVEELKAEMAAGRIRLPADGRVPKRIRRALLRGLSIEPERRFASMDELLSALSAERLPRWARIAALTSSLLVAAAAAGLLTYRQVAAHRAELCRGAAAQMADVWGDAPRRQVREAFQATGSLLAMESFQRVERALSAYGEAWVAMHREACEATRVRGEQSDQILGARMACLERRLGELAALTDLLRTVDAATVPNSAEAVYALPNLAECADVQALLSAVAPPPLSIRERHQASRRELDKGWALLVTGKYPEAIDIVNRVVADAAAMGYRPLEADALLLLGLLQEHSGRYAESFASLHKAALAADSSRHDETSVRAYLALAQVVGHQMRKEEGALWLKHAAAAIARAGSSERHRAMQAKVSALLAYDVDNLAVAHAQALEAVALLRRVHGPESLEVAAAQSLLGSILTNQNRGDEAVVQQEQAVALRIRALGPRHPSTAAALNNLAGAHLVRGDLEKSIELRQQALAIRLEVLGPRYPQTIKTEVDVARSQYYAGRYEEAAASLEDSVPRMESALGAEHLLVAKARFLLGAAHLGLGHLDRAMAAFSRGERIVEAVSPEGIDHCEMLVGIGSVHLAGGETTKALAVLERALLVAEKCETKGGHPNEIARARFALARALWESRGDRGRARRLAVQAQERFIQAGRGLQRELEEVERWLAKRAASNSTPRLYK